MSQSRSLLVLGIVVILAIVVVGVPFIEVEFQIPYTETENKQLTIGSVTSQTLESNHYLHWSENLVEGMDVVFTFSTNDNVDAYIFTPNQYNEFTQSLWADNSLKVLYRASSGMIGYFVPVSGTYYFVITVSPSLFGSDQVEINQCQIVASWEEEVIKYRTETEKITLLEKITGNY